ncbi:MAG: hypothetical protein ABSB15_22105 [Bryobacteraceae bacterium]
MCPAGDGRRFIGGRDCGRREPDNGDAAACGNGGIDHAAERRLHHLGDANGRWRRCLRRTVGKRPTVSLLADKIDAEDQNKTQVVFTTDGDSWHFDKLFIQGEESGYQFRNLK